MGREWNNADIMLFCYCQRRWNNIKLSLFHPSPPPPITYSLLVSAGLLIFLFLYFKVGGLRRLFTLWKKLTYLLTLSVNILVSDNCCIQVQVVGTKKKHEEGTFFTVYYSIYLLSLNNMQCYYFCSKITMS